MVEDIVTKHCAVKPPSTVVTIITDVPAANPVTRPVEETVATELFTDAHVTALFVAVFGATVAVSCSVLPSNTVVAVLTVTPVTDTVELLDVGFVLSHDNPSSNKLIAIPNNPDTFENFNTPVIITNSFCLVKYVCK
jgi:hypothetical protein